VIILRRNECEVDEESGVCVCMRFVERRKLVAKNLLIIFFLFNNHDSNSRVSEFMSDHSLFAPPNTTQGHKSQPLLPPSLPIPGSSNTLHTVPILPLPSQPPHHGGRGRKRGRHSLSVPGEVPIAKRNKTTTRRALEWFYDLVDDPSDTCVMWKGSQGHIVLHDTDRLLQHFKSFRKKDTYSLTNILHNFLRPYNFQEINGEKKVKNGNTYISLDLECDMPGMELSVFRPGNKDKLKKILHRGTGLPQRRFFFDRQSSSGLISLVFPLFLSLIFL